MARQVTNRSQRGRGDRDDRDLPDSFLTVSAATGRLYDSMFGNLRRAALIQDRKREQPGLQVSLGRRSEAARTQMTAAARSGEVTVYIWQTPSRVSRAVPSEVLGRLILVRGGIPDHPIRISEALRRSIDPDLAYALTNGVLGVRADEFDVWLTRERQRGLWLSQRGRKRKSRGRPRTDPRVRDAVLTIVRVNQWSAQEPGRAGSVAQLGRLVRERTGIGVSDDTLARTVDELFMEHGLEALRRKTKSLSRKIPS